MARSLRDLSVHNKRGKKRSLLWIKMQFLFFFEQGKGDVREERNLTFRRGRPSSCRCRWWFVSVMVSIRVNARQVHGFWADRTSHHLIKKIIKMKKKTRRRSVRHYREWERKRERKRDFRLGIREFVAAVTTLSNARYFTVRRHFSHSKMNPSPIGARILTWTSSSRSKL